MRRLVMILLVLELLLLRGAAVHHGHAHASSPTRADHANRPHFHVASHSHSSGRKADKHNHSRTHHHHHRDSDTNSSEPDVPSSNHDQSAFYVGCDVLTAAVERLELPAADGNSMLDSDFDRVADSVLPQFVAYSETGPPEGSIFAPLLVLPHILRL